MISSIIVTARAIVSESVSRSWPDERRPHVRDDRHTVVVGEILGIHERDDLAVSVELPEVQQRQVRAAAAAGAEDPGADRDRFDLVERNRADHSVNRPNSMSSSREE